MASKETGQSPQESLQQYGRDDSIHELILVGRSFGSRMHPSFNNLHYALVGYEDLTDRIKEYRKEHAEVSNSKQLISNMISEGILPETYTMYERHSEMNTEEDSKDLEPLKRAGGFAIFMGLQMESARNRDDFNTYDSKYPFLNNTVGRISIIVGTVIPQLFMGLNEEELAKAGNTTILALLEHDKVLLKEESVSNENGIVVDFSRTTGLKGVNVHIGIKPEEVERDDKFVFEYIKFTASAEAYDESELVRKTLVET